MEYVLISSDKNVLSGTHKKAVTIPTFIYGRDYFVK